jgi:hypothetical protein
LSARFPAGKAAAAALPHQCWPNQHGARQALDLSFAFTFRESNKFSDLG